MLVYSVPGESSLAFHVPHVGRERPTLAAIGGKGTNPIMGTHPHDLI